MMLSTSESCCGLLDDTSNSSFFPFSVLLLGKALMSIELDLLEGGLVGRSSGVKSSTKDDSDVECFIDCSSTDASKLNFLIEDNLALDSLGMLPLRLSVRSLYWGSASALTLRVADFSSSSPRLFRFKLLSLWKGNPPTNTPSFSLLVQLISDTASLSLLTVLSLVRGCEVLAAAFTSSVKADLIRFFLASCFVSLHDMAM
mmetsp:Transcript_8536/g.14816  ORF Transcript_8536/g.14816 Transcript_8536/m.14816 type:complete len:201 (+) Transcript_8536:1743-2345(+)